MSAKFRQQAIDDVLEYCRGSRGITIGVEIGPLLLGANWQNTLEGHWALARAMKDLFAAELTHCRSMVRLDQSVSESPKDHLEALKQDIKQDRRDLKAWSLLWAYYICQLDHHAIGDVCGWSTRTNQMLLKEGRETYVAKKIAELAGLMAHSVRSQVGKRPDLHIVPPAAIADEHSDTESSLINSEPDTSVRHMDDQRDARYYFQNSVHQAANRATAEQIALLIIHAVRPQELKLSRMVIEPLIEKALQGEVVVVGSDDDHGLGSGEMLIIVIVPIVVNLLTDLFKAKAVETFARLQLRSVKMDVVSEAQVRAMIERADIQVSRQELSRMVQACNDVLYAHLQAVPRIEQHELERRRTMMLREHRLRSEKLEELRADHAIQFQVAVKFQLRQQIADEEAAIALLVDELKDIERHLREGKDS